MRTFASAATSGGVFGIASANDWFMLISTVKVVERLNDDFFDCGRLRHRRGRGRDIGEYLFGFCSGLACALTIPHVSFALSHSLGLLQIAPSLLSRFEDQILVDLPSVPAAQELQYGVVLPEGHRGPR